MEFIGPYKIIELFFEIQNGDVVSEFLSLKFVFEGSISEK